jgi:hypothetical protein
VSSNVEALECCLFESYLIVTVMPKSEKGLNITCDINYDINDKMKCEKACLKAIQIGDLDI